MSVLNITDYVCNTTTTLCPINISKTEGEQPRFLGFILGMDPLSVLGKTKLNSTDQIHKYHSAVKLSDVIEMTAFLHVLKLVSSEDDSGACFCGGNPINPQKFQEFAQQIESKHKKTMTHMLWSTLMPQYYASDPKVSSDTYLKKYLKNNWNYFRNLGTGIMTHRWFFNTTWNAFKSFKREHDFPDRIKGVVQLTWMR